MQIVKVGIKAVLAVKLGIWLSDGIIINRIAMIAICYVFLTYYIWCISQFGMDYFSSVGGLFSLLLTGAYVLFAPFIPLIVFFWIFNPSKLPEPVESVLSILLIIVSIGFTIIDVARAVIAVTEEWTFEED